MAEEKTIPLAAIVIVTYNRWEDTKACLLSLQKITYANLVVIVVDQDSEDGTADAILESFPTLLLVMNPINEGFAAGCNQGYLIARDLGADYIFLLNNDTVVAPDILEPLVNAAESDPRIAIAGSLMLYYDSPKIIWSAGVVIGPLGQSVMLEQGRLLTEEENSARTKSVVDVASVVGCGMLIRRELFEQIGLIDEHFFLYYEESDFCARAKRAGWRIVTARDSRLWHKISRSTGTDSDLTLYYMRRNVLRYLEKNVPHSSIVRFHAVLDSIKLALVWVFQGRGNQSLVLVRASRDYVLNRMGQASWIET